MTRVAIVTTIDRNSAIARATLQTAAALAELAEVTIFAEPTMQPLDCPFPLRMIDDGLIRTHDHVVTVIGDSPFHVNAFWAARRMPSVVILHDVLIAHLVAAAMSLPDLSRELTRWYGPRQAAIVIARCQDAEAVLGRPDAARRAAVRGSHRTGRRRRRPLQFRR